MNLFAVSFFGHRQVDDPFLIERQLESIIREQYAKKADAKIMNLTDVPR